MSLINMSSVSHKVSSSSSLCSSLAFRLVLFFLGLSVVSFSESASLSLSVELPKVSIRFPKTEDSWSASSRTASCGERTSNRSECEFTALIVGKSSSSEVMPTAEISECIGFSISRSHDTSCSSTRL